MGGQEHAREIPLVIGFLGDLTGMPATDRPPLRDRRFVQLAAGPIREAAALSGSDNVAHRLLQLIELADADGAIRVRALDVTKAELAADFQRAPSIDQCALWKLIYEHEYGTFGGEPFGMMLADFSFTHGALDVAVLENFARIGADASCPFIAAASPRMFGLERWESFLHSERLESLFCSKAYADWHALRERDEARFVTLTAFDSALDVGAALIGAYARTGQWADAAASTNGATSGKADVHTLRRHGFLAGSAALREACTVQRPRRYHQPERTAEAATMARLSHVLTSSQFLRAVTCLARDRIGSYCLRADVESVLNRWIEGYVHDGKPTDGDDVPQRPALLAAKLQLQDVLGAPGQVKVMLDLQVDLADLEFSGLTRHAMRTVNVLGLI
jgi:type VI secretion system protein ImpC